ncbi:MAG: hypothetical protein LBB21_05830 [Holosporaceae bacterium]|jgi:hypothetical protein|nr:hypothetical protein [Holosporaceae bacterium]
MDLILKYCCILGIIVFCFAPLEMTKATNRSSTTSGSGFFSNGANALPENGNRPTNNAQKTVLKSSNDKTKQTTKPLKEYSFGQGDPAFDVSGIVRQLRGLKKKDYRSERQSI